MSKHTHHFVHPQQLGQAGSTAVAQLGVAVDVQEPQKVTTRGAEATGEKRVLTEGDERDVAERLAQMADAVVRAPLAHASEHLDLAFEKLSKLLVVMEEISRNWLKFSTVCSWFSGWILYT